MIATITTLRHCANCGCRYQGKPLPEDRLMERCQRLERAHLCPPCRRESFGQADAEFSAKRRELVSDQRAKRLHAWTKFVSENRVEEIAESDESRLRQRPEFARIEDWRYGPRGLILGGETGQSKTRLAMWLLRREFLAGKSIGYLKCATFHARLQASSRRHFGGDGELLEAWERADVLVIDDIGKGAINDQHEGKLFGIVDARTEAGKPVIATLNASGKALEAAMSEDRAGPFMRRLRFNESLKFISVPDPQH